MHLSGDETDSLLKYMFPMCVSPWHSVRGPRDQALQRDTQTVSYICI